MKAKVKTHLIITDIHEEFDINWCGRLMDSKPLIQNGKPFFIVVGGGGRIELNTADMKAVEYWGKRMTNPHGRQAKTSDTAYIYLKEIDDNEKLVCVIKHHHVKQYAPMYDKVGYK